MNDITIRSAALSDAAELLKIYEYYVNNTAITFEYAVPTLEEFEGRMTHVMEKYPYIVAVMDGKIVGYAYASQFKGRAAYDWAVETSIYVAQDMKRGGIGRLLYDVLTADLKAIGVINMNACIAYATDDDDPCLNNDSVAFHERLGFETVAHFHSCGFKCDKWYDMVWMEKIISEYPKTPAPLTTPPKH